MGGACGTHEGEGSCIQGFGAETRGKEGAWKTQVQMENNIKMDI